MKRSERYLQLQRESYIQLTTKLGADYQLAINRTSFE